MSLLLTLWVGGSGGGCCVDERRRGWGGVGSRLEGVPRSQIPALARQRRWGRGGGGQKKRDGIQIQQYGCTLQILLEFGGSRVKHQGEAIRLAESEPPDSSPFKRPHFWSRRGWGAGKGIAECFRPRRRSRRQPHLRLTCFKSATLMA